jgi:hypothetical protein
MLSITSALGEKVAEPGAGRKSHFRLVRCLLARVAALAPLAEFAREARVGDR